MVTIHKLGGLWPCFTHIITILKVWYFGSWLSHVSDWECLGCLSQQYVPSGILTRTLKIEKMYARTMLVVFPTFSSFGSVHVSVTHVTSPLTWTLKQAFLNSIQLTWTPYSGFSHEKWWFSIVMLVYQRVTVFVQRVVLCEIPKKIDQNRTPMFFSIIIDLILTVTMVHGFV
jgi:hypothetical protein